ncbi:hypothetical protein IQ07DRAFT_151685 [Pyrenochaeta sp. DS3sAY3a]|nr:hypothetical protein IQ07DRAFT_151685 [Pyrenochaeta sp. DS3sAY3a]
MALRIENPALQARDNDILSTDNLDFKTPTTITITEIPPSPPTSINDAPHDPSLVLNPAFVTQEFDLLRFEAAAYEQILTGNGLPRTTPTTPRTQPSDSNSDVRISANEEPQLENTSDDIDQLYSTHLISSPYNNPGHYLDLTTLPFPSLLFAKALSALAPTRPDYATAPYTSSLNFSVVLSVLRSLSADAGTVFPASSFYVVVFRSQLKEGIDGDWLYKLDYESHREACESGGLLKYWFGKGSGERRNLATCFWHSREDAYNGGKGPWHKKARAAGRELYESIVFSTHRFTVLEGATGYTFEDWKD